MVSNKHLEVEQQINLSGHNWHVSCLDFSSNGLYLASGSWDKTIRIWDLSLLETSIVIGTGENGHTSPVTSLSWLPNVEFLLVSGSADNTAAVWNMDNGSKLATFKQHFGWVLSTAVAPQGKTLCTASWDKSLHIIDVKSCQVISKLQGHSEGVWDCDFASNMTDILCSSSEDGSVKVWDTRVDNKWTTAKTLVGAHEDGVQCCDWSPCGTYIAAGSRDNKISIWDIRQNKLINFVEGHEDAVTDLCLFEMYSGGSIVMASAGDVSCRFWQPLSRSNAELSCLKYHDDGFEVECLAISPDKTLLATGGRDNKLMLSALKLDSFDIELRRLSEVDALLDGRTVEDSAKNGSSAAIVDHAVLRSDLLQKKKSSMAAKQTIKIKVKPTSDLLQSKLMQLKPNSATVEERSNLPSNTSEQVKDHLSQLRKVDDPGNKSPNLETFDNALRVSVELETRRKTLKSPILPNERPTAEAEGSMRYKSKTLLGERTRLRHVENFNVKDDGKNLYNGGEVFFNGNGVNSSSGSSSMSSGTNDSQRDSTLDRELNGVVRDMINMSEEDLSASASRPFPRKNNWSYDAQL